MRLAGSSLGVAASLAAAVAGYFALPTTRFRGDPLEVLAEVFNSILGLLKPSHQPCNRIVPRARAEHTIFGTIGV